MGFLEKFNDWYIRSIPEIEPSSSVVWWGPAAAARYRWKEGFNGHLVWLVVIFFCTLLLSSGRRSNPSLEFRLVMAAIATIGYAWLAWVCRDASQKIVLTPQWLVIGADARGAKFIRLDKLSAVAVTEIDGHRVLLVQETPKNSRRIYLDLNREKEVRELLAKAGWLKSFEWESR